MIKNSISKTKKIIVQCILGIIILSLILSTMNNYIRKDMNRYVAEINGEKISLEKLINLYTLEQDKQKKILGKDFLKISNNEKFKQKIYNYTLSQMINNILLEQYTKKIQFHEKDEEIKKIILNIPIFQTNNTFDNKKYLNYLESINLKNYEYIDLVKKKINTNNLINAIAETNFILEDEKKYIIQLLSQKRVIKKAILKINSFIEKQKTNIEEVYNYFKKNKNKFYIPEKFKVSYIHLKPNTKNIKYSINEINQWYKKNINKYFYEEKKKYSIIQIKNKKDALLIFSQLKKGKNFSEIAREKSIDPVSSKKNGDIGWIESSLTPNEIKYANLKKINQISHIIPFKNEFLIIQLTDISPKRFKKLSEVFNVIEKEIKYKKSIQKYNELISNISNIAHKYINQFDIFIKKTNLTPIETKWFDKNSIPKNLNNTALKKIIFEKKLLNKNNSIKLHSGLITLKNHESFILYIKGFKEKKTKQFQNAKKEIINIIKKDKAIQEIKNKLNKIMFYLNQNNENVLKKENIYFEPSEIISRYDENSIVPTIFSMPYPNTKKNIYTTYQNQNKDFAIIKLLKVYNQPFSSEETNIITQYLEKNNVDEIFNCMLKYLREKSIIKYNLIQD